MEATNKLLTATFFEQIAIWGFRAIVVLLLVTQAPDGLALGQETALALYTDYWFYIPIFMLVGGLLADFVLGSFKTYVIGIVVACVGLLLLPNSAGIGPGFALLLIAAGIGCIAPCIPAMFAQHLQDNPARLQSRLVWEYIWVSLAALVGPVVVSIFIEGGAYVSGVYLALFCLFIALIMVYWSKSKLDSKTLHKSFEDVFSGSKLYRGFALVIVITVLFLLLKINIGLIDNWTGDEVRARVGESMANLITLVFFIGMAIAAFAVLKINKFFFSNKLAISFAVLSAPYLMSEAAHLFTSAHLSWFVLVSLIASTTEVVCAILLIYAIARYGYMPLMNTSIGLCLAVTTLSVSYISGVTEKASYWPIFALLSALVCLALLSYGFKQKQAISI